MINSFAQLLVLSLLFQSTERKIVYNSKHAIANGYLY